VYWAGMGPKEVLVCKWLWNEGNIFRSSCDSGMGRDLRAGGSEDVRSVIVRRMEYLGNLSSTPSSVGSRPALRRYPANADGLFAARER
jgi:hypothetical protein